MKLARYWSRATSKASGPGGMVEGVARGWSNASMEDARRMASELAGRVATRLASNQMGKDKQYLYGDRPLPEPVIEEFAGDSGPRAAITRNVYGALVLNAGSLMFLDIDRLDPVDPPSSSDLFSGLLSLFSKPAPPKHKGSSPVVAGIAHVAQRNGLAVRVYRTAGGYRGIVTNRGFEPGTVAAEALLLAFGCDPLYIRLCKLQQSFRARLTPKPWRCGVKMPPVSFPFETPQQESRFRQWLSGYEANAVRCATCQYVTTAGGGEVDPALEDLIARHDRETRAQSNLPLA